MCLCAWCSNVLFSLSPARRTNSDPIKSFRWDSIANMEISSSQKNNIESLSWIANSSFSSAMALLRANVITLCLRTGIMPEKLYPSEAILLNLHVLHRFCIDQGKKAVYTPYVSPELLSDFHSKPCLDRLRDRYKSSRWSFEHNANARANNNNFDTFPKTADAISDNARIVSFSDSEWAVIDVEKHHIS